ncbi:MAG: hypothetical protein H0V53_11485 [Rubrobacter sp.]|nr:hypothetical protein [Rubrobacter sp.]
MKKRSSTKTLVRWISFGALGGGVVGLVLAANLGLAYLSICLGIGLMVGVSIGTWRSSGEDD